LTFNALPPLAFADHNGTSHALLYFRDALHTGGSVCPGPGGSSRTALGDSKTGRRDVVHEMLKPALGGALNAYSACLFFSEQETEPINYLVNSPTRCPHDGRRNAGMSQPAARHLQPELAEPLLKPLLRLLTN
jgi:hypothetical protein